MKIVLSSRQRWLINMFMIIVYRLSLELIFIKIIIPYFSYRNMVFQWIPGHTVISWILLCPTILILIRLYHSEYISDMVVVVLLIFNFIPSTIYYSYSQMNFFWLFVMFYFCLILANTLIPHFIFKMGYRLDHPFLSNCFLAICVAIPVYIWGKYAKFRIYTNIFKVYAIRAEARQYDLSTLLRYGFTMVQVLLPILSIYFIAKKKKINSILAIFAELLVFCINGSKSAVFSVIIVLCTYIAYKCLGNISKWITVGITALNFIAYIELIFHHTYKVGNIFINRLLFMPNLLNYFYYEFFNSHGFDWFQSGFLSHFGFEPKYGLSLPRVIGTNYYGNFYGNEVTNANNGLFSDAYANLGLLGIIIMPIFTIILLRFYDACANKLDKSIQTSCVVMAAMKIMGDSLFTVFLSGGMCATFALLLILPRNDFGKNSNSLKTHSSEYLLHNKNH